MIITAQIEYCVWYCERCGLEILFPRKMWDAGADVDSLLPRCKSRDPASRLVNVNDHVLGWADQNRECVLLDDSVDFAVEKKVDRFEKIIKEGSAEPP